MSVLISLLLVCFQAFGICMHIEKRNEESQQVTSVILSCHRCCCNQGKNRDAATDAELQHLDDQTEENNETTSGRNENENITNSSQTDTNLDNQVVSTEAVDSQEGGSRRVQTFSSVSQSIIEEENVNGMIAVSGSSHEGGEGNHDNVNSQNLNETSPHQEGEGDNDNVESRFTYDFLIVSDNKSWEKDTLKKLELKKKRNGKNMKGFYGKRDILPGKIRQTAVNDALIQSKTCVVGYMKEDFTHNPLYVAVMQQENILKNKEYRKGRLIPVKIEKDSVIPEEIGNAVQAHDGWESDVVDILYEAIESISDVKSF